MLCLKLVICTQSPSQSLHTKNGWLHVICQSRMEVTPAASSHATKHGLPVEAVVKRSRVCAFKAVPVCAHARSCRPLLIIIHIKDSVVEAPCLAYHRDGAIPAANRRLLVEYGSSQRTISYRKWTMCTTNSVGVDLARCVISGV